MTIKKSKGLLIQVAIEALPFGILHEAGLSIRIGHGETGLKEALAILGMVPFHRGLVDQGDGQNAIILWFLSPGIWAAINMQRKFEASTAGFQRIFGHNRLLGIEHGTINFLGRWRHSNPPVMWLPFAGGLVWLKIGRA